MARLLRLLTNLAALGLVAAVLFAPFLDVFDSPASPWERLVALFARDRVLRHTSLACALGLSVSARIFFPSRSDPNRVDPPQQTAA